MKALLNVILLLAFAGALVWYFTEGRNNPEVREAEKDLVSGAAKMRDAIKESLPESLKSEDVKEQLARTGKIVRQKARKAGGVLADATADARITAAIKARYLAERDLSTFQISVNTTAGVVTLAGFVSSEEKLAKAMNLALEIDGVSEVISTLQVKEGR